MSRQTPSAPVCPVCRSESTHESWQYASYRIFACAHCDLQFAHPLRSASLDYYQENYDQIIRAALAGEVHPGFRYTINKIRSAAERYLGPRQRRVIDIGCGTGYVLSELQRAGFDCFGVDFNPEVVKVARDLYGLPAQVARVEDLIALHQRFDLALLVHVLEHVEQPADLLASIRHILHPGGLLVIDLPNRNRFALRRSIRKGEWSWGEYPPHHLTFWSATALSRALQITGYSVLECHPRPLGEESQIELFLANRLGLPRGAAVERLAGSLRAVGRRLGLQGETLYAVARP